MVFSTFLMIWIYNQHVARDDKARHLVQKGPSVSSFRNNQLSILRKTSWTLLIISQHQYQTDGIYQLCTRCILPKPMNNHTHQRLREPRPIFDWHQIWGERDSRSFRSSGRRFHGTTRVPGLSFARPENNQQLYQNTPLYCFFFEMGLCVCKLEE